MTYRDAEQFLLSLENIPRREYMKDPRQCGIYLRRVQFFLDILGNPEKKIPHYVHVTGTSGKGSVCNFIASILKTHGARVGQLESPHPARVIERWKINGRAMPKNDFTNLVEYIKPKLDEYARESPYDMISFPELMTALGLMYFAREHVDWAVLEVGCGGRYSATNVIPKKDAAVITNIGLDHTDILGDTKEKIAYEKAGIIILKSIVWTAESDENVLNIIRNECRKKKVKLKICNFTFSILKQDVNEQIFEYENETFTIHALGEHQIKNAILAINVARDLGIGVHAIKKALPQTIQPLRMEVVSRRPLVILDGAHNPDKIKTTVKTIKQIRDLQSPIPNLHLVVGFSGNKDIGAMIKQLAALKPQSIAVTRNTINPFRKVANPSDIRKRFKKLLPRAKTEIFLNPSDAFVWGKKQQKKTDILIVTGSLFIAGELPKD